MHADLVFCSWGWKFEEGHLLSKCLGPAQLSTNIGGEDTVLQIVMPSSEKKYGENPQVAGQWCCGA